MLNPRHRQVYLDALQPPAGFVLDHAVGTTFSLDLPTLLAVPLGFAMLHWENAKGELSVDPVTLLHALRRCADRVTVFCQEGQIAAPAKHHPLFAYLEPMIMQVHAPEEDGLFHAKTWLLRFTDGDSVVYRFICLSRNITRDRSWDTVLALDGSLTERERSFSRNHPLGNFVAALPGMARVALEPTRRTTIERMAEEVRRVDFQPPEGFEEVAFWPMGLAGPKKKPLEGRIDRLLVVSPYVGEEFLRRLAETAPTTLISRTESLEAIAPAVLEPFSSRLYVLDDAALEEEGDSEGNEDTGRYALEHADVQGLHAKLFVADEGWYSSVWTGSANATTAAFDRNVEFLVQLRGKKKSGNVGIDAFLGNETEPGFHSLLRPFRIGDQRQSDPELRANEERVELARRRIASAGLRVRVQQSGGTAHDLMILQRDRRPVALGEVRAHCWPATLNRSMARDVASIARDGSVVFTGLTVYALTAFICFEVTAGEEEKRAVARFALSLPLEGAPQDRLDQILSSVLGDRDRLLRYILFLVAGDDAIAALGNAFLARSEPVSDGSLIGSSGGVAAPLLEELMRALARSPEKLDAVARLVADLRRTAAGTALLPPHFDEIWEPIWSARLAQKETAA